MLAARNQPPRRPTPIGCHSLTRAASMRTWRPLDSASLAGPAPSMGAPADDARAKFNTLTPAEAAEHARRLRASTRGRAPSRTASVLRKPRAPGPPAADQLDCAPPGTPLQRPSDRRQAKHTLAASTSKLLTNFKRLLFPGQPPAGSNSELGSSSTLGDSISQLCLDRSQSPIEPPEPLASLKSINYLAESRQTLNYSNYDDFTRFRNDLLSQQRSAPQTSPQHAAHSDLHYNLDYLRQSSAQIDQQHQENRHNQQQQHQQQQDVDQHSWQLTSLPANLERNLTTVFEHRPDQSRALQQPPTSFHSARKQEATRTSSPAHSLSSILTLDSELDSGNKFAHQISATRPTSFRFSYAQPLVFESNNTGLPPDPRYGSFKADPTAIRQQHCGGTSSGGSSLKSNSTNGITTGSEQVSPGALSSCSDKSSLNDDLGLYSQQQQHQQHQNHHHQQQQQQQQHARRANDEANLDADTTIISDTSTVRGDSLESGHSTALYVDRCAQLELTVESLKNKLLAKEKELTELQLKLLSADFQVDKLKGNLARLEKDNSQLRSLVHEQRQQRNNSTNR